MPELLDTLKALAACDTPPAEVIVHVDGGDQLSVDALKSLSSDVRILESSEILGPGGSRNRLLHAARNEVIVSLDDDSFPIDSDFFSAVDEAVKRHPTAGVIAMNIIHDGEALAERRPQVHPVADFVGCGSVYRKRALLNTAGYVPIQPAYGVEEADLALQIIDAGWDIIHDHDLRVRHATSRSHQATPTITSAHISNLALLAYLRYPVIYWPLGILQVANRIIWSIRNGRTSGVLAGLAAIPGKIWRYRAYRKPVSAATMRKVRRLRHEANELAIGGG
ncbi:GT2 family glycosyltransferase [Erythromicrobium ramosum]|uniref:Glycosyltransferase n=1 Tax=Erythrobacter ramosus TaxID=35811 RepID=A0A6I4UNG3_9SPHN|nr:GT2 family glycosyltransferase [Erythrobacter ramosus]MXP39946.1 glycosyltransferase [Erythrobacter ramosus]